MSDDEPDLELLALLRQHLQGKLTISDEPETGVLEGAEYVYDNAIDVAIDMRSCKNAAAAIHAQMRQKDYSPATWATHELHPDAFDLGDDAALVAFVFTMDLLNFSFWSEKPEAERFAVEYRGKRWTGYWSLVAALRRALDEGGFPLAFRLFLFSCNLLHPGYNGVPRSLEWLAGWRLHTRVHYSAQRCWSNTDTEVNEDIEKRNPNHGLAFLARRGGVHPGSPAAGLPVVYQRGDAPSARAPGLSPRGRQGAVRSMSSAIGLQGHPSPLTSSHRLLAADEANKPETLTCAHPEIQMPPRKPG